MRSARPRAPGRPAPVCRDPPRILPCPHRAVPASDVYYSRCPTHDGREGYGRRPLRTSRVRFDHTVRSAGRYSGACGKQRTNCGMSRDPQQIPRTGDIAAGDQDRMPVRDRCRGSGQDMQRRLVGGPDMAVRPTCLRDSCPGYVGRYPGTEVSGLWPSQESRSPSRPDQVLPAGAPSMWSTLSRSVRAPGNLTCNRGTARRAPPPVCERACMMSGRPPRVEQRRARPCSGTRCMPPTRDAPSPTSAIRLDPLRPSAGISASRIGYRRLVMLQRAAAAHRRNIVPRYRTGTLRLQPRTMAGSDSLT